MSHQPRLPDRRQFVQASAATAGVVASGAMAGAASESGDAENVVISRFDRPDSLCIGEGWETLNPGYWQIKDHHLRRRFNNYGERARPTGFPFHYETHGMSGGVMPVVYDPSLPPGVVYRNDWRLEGAWAIHATFVFHGHADVRREGDADSWKMYQPGYGMMGLALGAKNLLESFNQIRHASLVGWTDDGKFGFLPKSGKASRGGRPAHVVDAPELKPGDVVRIFVEAKPAGQQTQLTATMHREGDAPIVVELAVPRTQSEGFVGIAARGLVDFAVRDFAVHPVANRRRTVGVIDCYTCYALGDTLKKVDGKWRVRFVALFASDGRQAEVRVAERPDPPGGWENVKPAGRAPIVNNRWRRNTAVIEATLPADPSTRTLYYTVWKDGRNVTSDPRIGTDATGPGTGLVGDVPSSGDYVGRLPRLAAPYRVCGLSCHAITSGLQQKTPGGWQILGGGDQWHFRDQPTVDAYRELEEYGFQIMCWEDDVWYMELVLYPPSTDDAMKIVTLSIAGPTSRWQMMRHWNILNPGDHDYGMDDVKGPEQIAIRRRDDLGQDPDYMRRNFQIVHHLVTGEEEVDPLANPKKWRAWKMPAGDFTLAILDSRLWRSSQDTAIWDDEGWGHVRTVYDRRDPTRSLLGEEQFAWLQQLVRTDSSRLICLTGLNGLHTVWTGGKRYSRTDEEFPQRDRVAADYAGWVAAGADRVIELLGSRDGIVTVYGDVHNGCIMKNVQHRLIECSFGPIGRSGGRSVIKGFGPQMHDYDGRPLEVFALYHQQHADPTLARHPEDAPFYWNFLEMEFDPRPADPTIVLRVRNLVDGPNAAPRGGNELSTTVSQTGRVATSQLPTLKTLPRADVRIMTTDGTPLRGTRSGGDGYVLPTRLVDVPPGTELIVTAYDGRRAESKVVRTVPTTA